MHGGNILVGGLEFHPGEAVRRYLNPSAKAVSKKAEQRVGKLPPSPDGNKSPSHHPKYEQRPLGEAELLSPPPFPCPQVWSQRRPTER